MVRRPGPRLQLETRIKLPAAALVRLAEGKTTTSIWYCPAMAPGVAFQGPALILEDMATLLVLPDFDGWMDNLGHINLQARNP
jgi:hypothetical protein